MTWQKVKTVQTEAQLKIKADGGDAVEVPNATWGDRPTYELENKSGDVYEFTSYSQSLANTSAGTAGVGETRNGNTAMAEDIAEALADGAEVWVDVDFDGGYVKYWAEGAPWDGGDVRDNYGIEERH